MSYGLSPIDAASINEHRLTLTSGTAVTTANVTGATTMYMTPHVGDRIALYDGTAKWQVYNTSEISLALGTLTNALPYDVFCYANAGVPTLEFLAWTNGTTRATALVRQNGVWAKTGALTRRYVGTFFTTATTTTEDSTSNRYLFNASNRVARKLLAVDTSDSWTYTTATFRSANASTAAGVGRFNVMIGLSEDPLKVQVNNMNANDTAAISVSGGVGIDSTSVNSADLFTGVALVTGVATNVTSYIGYPGVGQHFIQRLEISSATGVTTWYGDNNLAYILSGMTGTLNG